MRIIQGDALEEIPKIEEESIDLVLTDPPYNISRKNNFHTMPGRKGLDFGEWDKGFDQISWLKEVSKVVKKGGSIIIFNSYRNFGNIIEALEDEGFVLKDCIRWVKSNPMPRNIYRRYVVDFEFAIWLVKEKGKWTYNNILEKGYQRPEFIYPIVGGKEKTNHPTQKPISLMEHLIKIHSNKGDLILDPFMGSGTTGVAAKNLERDFIGIELSEEYFKTAEERINNTSPKLDE